MIRTANKILCNKCDTEKNEKEFYISKSDKYFSLGKIPICKECIGKKYNEYYEKYKSERTAIYHLCMYLWICFNDTIYKMASSAYSKEDVKTPIWQLYIQKLNSLGRANGAGIDFDESDLLEETSYTGNDEIIIDSRVKKRWGKGFTYEDYQWLEEDYMEWTTHTDCSQISVQKLVRMICIKELQIQKAREQNKQTDKLEKSLLDLMNNSNLTPKTMSALNESESTKIYGTWIRDIEQTRPAEYFQDKKLYNDFDGIKDYYNRFILRPLKNLLTGSRDFDHEFNVENDDENLNNDGE